MFGTIRLCKSYSTIRTIKSSHKMSNFVDIDGSILEGGGQILRMSVAFSAILGIPVRISNIRAGRSKPGLAAQHLKGIQLVADMCSAKLSGASLGSTYIEFVPGKLRNGHYMADTQTAGSISLLLQVALPCALLADGPVTLDLKGGTNADMAPQVDYLTEVFKPLLERFGGTFDFELHKRGYFPKGGGHVTVHVTPVKGFHGVTLTDLGEPSRGKVTGWSYVAGTLPLKLAHQMANGAKHELCSFVQSCNIESYKESNEMAPYNCNGIILLYKSTTGCILGSDALGKRGLDNHTLGQAAAAQLKNQVGSGACLDSHAQDQVILYMTLAEGRSQIKVTQPTLHTKTAIHIAEMLAKVKFTVTPTSSTNYEIECTGIGFKNNLPN